MESVMVKAVAPVAPPAAMAVEPAVGTPAAMTVEPAVGTPAPPAVEPTMAPATAPSTPAAGVADGSPSEEQDQPESQGGAIWLHVYSTHTGIPLFTREASDCRVTIAPPHRVGTIHPTRAFRTAIFLHDPRHDILRLFVLESSLPSSYFVGGLEINTSPTWLSVHPPAREGFA